jgi:signal transduction histidine kinase
MNNSLKDFPNDINYSTSEITKMRSILDEFIYRCSHDMSAPLKTITGLLNLIEETEDTDLEGACVDMVLVCLKRIEFLLQEIDQILNNEETEVEPELICFQDLMRHVLSGFEDQLKEHRIRVSVEIHEKHKVFSDINRIQILLTHMISNAILFCDKKKENKKIDIGMVATPKACAIYIKDNGIGMDELVKEKIFQPFFRGSEKSTGAGLGLFVADAIIRKMGGKISVISQAGRGSAFSFWIPNGKILIP